MFSSKKPKKPTNFSSLPVEIRQQVYLRALPEERRLIGLDIVGLTACFPQACWWGTIQVTYLIGARLYATPSSYDSSRTSCKNAYKHFIQPSETQVTIATLAQLERASRCLTTKVFPDLLCLQIPPPPNPRNPYRSGPDSRYLRRRSRLARVLPCGMGTELINFLEKPEKQARSGSALVRCSFQRDIFFVHNIHKKVAVSIPDFRAKQPATRVSPAFVPREVWVNGLETIRKFQRIAAYRDLVRERRWIDCGIARNIFDELLSLREIMPMGHAWKDFVSREDVLVELTQSPHQNSDNTRGIPAEPPLSLFAEPCQPEPACKHLMLGQTTVEGFREWASMLLKQLDMWMEKNPSVRRCSICGDSQHEQLLKHRIGRINESKVESDFTVTLRHKDVVKGGEGE